MVVGAFSGHVYTAGGILASIGAFRAGWDTWPPNCLLFVVNKPANSLQSWASDARREEKPTSQAKGETRLL